MFNTGFETGGYGLTDSGVEFFSTFVTVFIFIIGIVILITPIAGLASKTKEWNRNNHSPIEQYLVSVVTKREKVSYYHHDDHVSSSTFYYITFEFPDGGRREFRVDGTQYGMIAEKDTGLLRFQGTRFLEFCRV